MTEVHPLRDDMIKNVDRIIEQARRKTLEFLQQREDGLPADQTPEQRRLQLIENVEDIMDNLRAWIMRGGTDLH